MHDSHDVKENPPAFCAVGQIVMRSQQVATESEFEEACQELAATGCYRSPGGWNG